MRRVSTSRAVSTETKLLQLRKAATQAQDLLDAIEDGLKPLLYHGTRSERSGVVRDLRDQIGPPPINRSWQDEWKEMTVENFQFCPFLRTLPEGREAEERLVTCSVAEQEAGEGFPTAIKDKIELGWGEAEAKIYSMLFSRKGPIARALRDGDDRYAASTYAMCNAIFKQQQVASLRGKDPMYTHLTGLAGLSTSEPKWDSLTDADRTGFRGLTSSAVTSADNDPVRFTVDGHCAYHYAEKAMKAVDSDVVCFMPREADTKSAHAPILIHPMYGAFPPNTLYRLIDIKEKGEWEAPGGIRVNQRLLVVTATYRRPLSDGPETAALVQSAKMCAQLSFGTRASFIAGIDDLIELTVLMMSDEWAREHTWTDWGGQSYTMRDVRR
jgi:hypothetical protein